MRPRTPSSSILGLFGWLAIAFTAAAAGAVASADAAGFYASLAKPSWAPPAGVFGPVWSVLYSLMGVSAWLVWRTQVPRAQALSLFCIQLAANVLWSWLFFAWHLGGASVLEILVLLALIAATWRAFSRISRAAAWLLVPYLLWVSFASALTLAVWRGNPWIWQ